MAVICRFFSVFICLMGMHFKACNQKQGAQLVVQLLLGVFQVKRAYLWFFGLSLGSGSVKLFCCRPAVQNTVVYLLPLWRVTTEKASISQTPHSWSWGSCQCWLFRGSSRESRVAVWLQRQTKSHKHLRSSETHHVALYVSVLKICPEFYFWNSWEGKL